MKKKTKKLSNKKFLKEPKALWFLFLFLIIVNITTFVLKNKESFVSAYDETYWRDQYENSQWAKGWYATTSMSDADLYAVSGLDLINGANPNNINRETPPLGKFFIGLSIVLFKNPNVVSIFWAIGTLLLIYLVGRQLFKSKLLVMMAVTMFSFDRLFLEQINTSRLDLPLLFFVLLATFFFLKGMQKKKYLFFSVLSLSAVATVKMYPLAIVLGGVFLLFLILKKEFSLIWIYLKYVPFGILLYIIIHSSFILQNSLSDFVYLHYWIIHFVRNQVPNYHPFEILRILFLGKWLFWIPDPPNIDFILEIRSVAQWNVLWAIGAGLTIFGFFKGLFKREVDNKFLLKAIVVGYLSFFLFSLPYPRYILPILPFLYLMLFSFGLENRAN